MIGIKQSIMGLCRKNTNPVLVSQGKMSSGIGIRIET